MGLAVEGLKQFIKHIPDTMNLISCSLIKITLKITVSQVEVVP